MLYKVEGRYTICFWIPADEYVKPDGANSYINRELFGNTDYEDDLVNSVCDGSIEASPITEASDIPEGWQEREPIGNNESTCFDLIDLQEVDQLKMEMDNGINELIKLVKGNKAALKILAGLKAKL